MSDTEYSKKKGLVKQYTNQAEKLLNEYQHRRNRAKRKYMLGEETANLPEWFFNINPIFYESAAKILKGKHPEIVRYIPAGVSHRTRSGLITGDIYNPNGTIVFGPRMAERAFDAKTGEFLWLS